MGDFDILPFHPGREIVIDAGYLATRRHITYGLVEADVTKARELRRTLQARNNTKISFTAFLVATLARAIAAKPRVQAYRDWRRRLVVFHDVDVVTLIEPEPGVVAIPHIIRNANQRSVSNITQEIRAIQSAPEKSDQNSNLIAIARRLPRFARLFFFWAVKLNPHWFRRFEGTVVVTSVGMFGNSGGWGIGFLPTHTLGLTVGGIAQKPGVHDGEVSVRDYLNLTLSFDHDIVDGAPATRFTRELIGLIESATLMEEELD
jgi:pyruvate/2-oxoglutarate dehydrogenase complex dihydrolipoamide acyltransferase (E2) component